MGHQSAENETGNLMYAFGLLGGGLTLGFGVLLLWYSFGITEEGGMFLHLDKIGASGLNDIGLLGGADFSIGMILVGALAMVFFNSRAWRDTGGY